MIKNENYSSRDKIYGGDQLIKLIKKACGNDYLEFSKKNNKNLQFNQFWSTLSETRHAIIHSSSKVKKVKVAKSIDHFETFKYLFDYEEINDEIILIKLNYKQLDKILKHVAEFGYQILKLLSQKENLEYKLR